MTWLRLLLSVLTAATLQFCGTSASAQNREGGKALEQPMLSGGSFGESQCEELTSVFDGTVERQQGKAKTDQLKMALLGWFEGYMEGFRIGTSYNRPDFLVNLTGLKAAKIAAELKNYCATHGDWMLLAAAIRVSMQIAQDTTGRYK